MKCTIVLSFFCTGFLRNLHRVLIVTNSARSAMEISYLHWLEFVITLEIHVLLIPSVTSLVVHDAVLGRNVTIDFMHAHGASSSVDYELFVAGHMRPFVINGELSPHGLDPGQRDRFLVNVLQNRIALNITLTILNLKHSDAGLYILSVRDVNDRGHTNSIIDAYIDVKEPPFMCNVQDSEYSSDYMEVYCRAELGNDGKNRLICYQNQKKAPYRELSQREDSLITATYWMLIDFPISCCLYALHEAMNPDLCTDFVYSHQRIESYSHVVTTETILSTTGGSVDSTDLQLEQHNMVKIISCKNGGIQAAAACANTPDIIMFVATFYFLLT